MMLTDMKTRLERATICQACEHYRRSIKQCTECGCLVNFKVIFAASSCPIGKWKESKISNPLNDILNKK